MSIDVDDELWAAIGDPIRRRLLDLLLAGAPGAATGLSREPPVSRQAAAKHLAVLYRAGPVGPQRTGREVRYRVDAEQFARASAQLAAANQTWDTRLRRIRALAEAIEQKTRTDPRRQQHRHPHPDRRAAAAMTPQRISPAAPRGRFSVRRMAAIDMCGPHGSRFRRRIVTAEFIGVPLLATALGALLLAHGASAVWSIEVLGAALNYVPLAVHAMRMVRSTRLEAELAGVDTYRELRRYGPATLLLFVPGLILLLGLRTGDWTRPIPADS